MPTEEEIREVVTRIVTGLGVASSPAPAASPPPRPQPESASAPETRMAPDAGAGGRIAIAADHGGYPLKERLAFRLREAGWDVDDCGTHGGESVDYPDFAHAAARKVAEGDCRWGIVVDGAGIGSAMAANKVPGVRAALCYDVSTARNSREHNHANVLTLGAGMIGDGLAWQIVEAWLATPWGEGRHARRVAKITEIERAYTGTLAAR